MIFVSFIDYTVENNNAVACFFADIVENPNIVAAVKLNSSVI